MRNLKLSILFIVMILSLQSMATEQWRTYTGVANLGEGPHRGIVADNKGNIWITGTGLSKYAGGQWTYYSSDLVWLYTICVAADKNDNTWIGTFQGISLLDSLGTWTSYTINNSGLANNWIESVAIDSSRVKWFGTHAGASSFNGKNWTNYKASDGLAADTVNAIVVDKNNNKWFGTERGLSKFDGTTWKTYTTTDGLPANNINGLTIDSSGNIWIATWHGLVKYDGSTWRTYTTADGLASDSIWSVTSRGGIVWAGFYRNEQKKGAAKFDGASWTNYTVYDEDPDYVRPAVPTLAIDTFGDTWFASQGEAVFVTNNLTHNWQTYLRTAHMYLDIKHSAATDADGFYNWFGSDGGLTAIAEGGNAMKYTTPGAPTAVTDIAVDVTGGKWFSTMSGLYYLSNTWDPWVTYTTTSGLPTNSLTSVAVDYESNKWIGTENNGVIFFNGLSWKNYTTADGLPSNSITDIIMDAKGRAWICTQASGISCFDGTTWKNYTTTDGLISNNVICAALDIDGALWFGTDKGLSKYNGTTWTNFTTTDGLAGNKVNVIKIDNAGIKWIGCYKRPTSGLTKFDNTTWKTYTWENSVDVMDNVYSITIDGNGSKWIGTQDGSIVLLKDGGATAYSSPKRRIIGILFNDANGNGIKDGDESALGLDKQVVKVDSLYTTTNAEGVFTILAEAGKHVFTYVPYEYWQMTTSQITMTTGNAREDSLYIGLRATQAINDVKISITGSRARVLGSSNYWIDFRNTGSVPQSGSIVLTLDSLTRVSTTSSKPDTITGNRLVWNFKDLSAQAKGQILVVATMPDFTHLGDTLQTISSINIANQDLDLSNNTSSLDQVLVGSCDPNDKEVAQGTGDKNYVLHNSLLEYTIHFQNTGTDTAYVVNIADTINANLDLGTLQITGSSHTVSTQIKDARTVIFSFNKINLPPVTTNETASNGYIKYSIKPITGLADNTEVTNTASIYFDYNPAVVTNTVSNAFVSIIPNGVTGSQVTRPDNGTRIYPNPATDGFYVKTSIPTSVTLFALSGEKLWTKNIPAEKYLDISSLPKGMYIVELVNENGITEQKLIKE